MVQKPLTHQDLLDLYLLDKESVVKQIEGRDYKSYEPILLPLNPNALFFRKSDGSEIIFAFDSDSVSDLIYSDSLEKLHVIISGLKNNGWSLHKKRDQRYEVYKNEEVNFLVVFQINSENEMPMIQIIEKFKKQT